MTWEGHCNAEALKWETDIVLEIVQHPEAWSGRWECTKRGQSLKSLLCLAESLDFILKAVGVF